MAKRAIILAGGKGTRLRPYTVVLPKPLMPIGEYPILEVIVRQLIKAGFDHITMAVNHQANLIKAFFLDGSQWGIRIDYSQENEPLGTMGPLRIIQDLPENFLVMNGDILTNLDFDKFYNDHINENACFTISAKQRLEKIDYGVLEIDKKDQLINFKEKPEIIHHVSMGIYMVSSQIIEYIPKEVVYGFDNLMFDLIAFNKLPNVKPFDDYWLDIGRPGDYNEAIEIFEKSPEKFLKEDNNV